MKRKSDYPETDNKPESREQLRARLTKTEDEIKDIVGYEPLDFYLFDCPGQETLEKIDELLSTRASILDKLFAYSQEEIRRIETVNNLLLRLTEQMYQRTANLYRTILKSGRDDSFDDYYEVEGTLNVDVWYEDDEQDSADTVLRLNNDTDYLSDFPYMIFLIQQHEKTDELHNIPFIHKCSITHNEHKHPDMTDRQLGCNYAALDDGISWDECLHSPNLSHICFCYAFHTLYADHHYSLADIIRINSFRAEAELVCQRITDLTGRQYKDIYEKKR